MQRKVMISCAVTGSADTPGRNPAVPVTPQQIAQSAIDAAKAGAAIVHIHVRDPQTTRPSMELGALPRGGGPHPVRAGSTSLINLTTGPGARFVPGEEDPKKPGPRDHLKPPARARAPRPRAAARHLQPRHGQHEHGPARVRQYSRPPRGDGGRPSAMPACCPNSKSSRPGTCCSPNA